MIELFVIRDLESGDLKCRRESDGKSKGKNVIRFYRSKEAAEKFAEKIYGDSKVEVVRIVEAI